MSETINLSRRKFVTRDLPRILILLSMSPLLVSSSRQQDSPEIVDSRALTRTVINGATLGALTGGTLGGSTLKSKIYHTCEGAALGAIVSFLFGPLIIRAQNHWDSQP